MINYFQRSEQYPFHISIGAIVVDKDKNIGCHYFNEHEIPGSGIYKDFYILMRETIEPMETIEDCLKRGLMEEFGAEATIRHYIGSIVARFRQPRSDLIVEKTALYFLCDLLSLDQSRRKMNDPESGSIIKWLPLNDLIESMKKQKIILKREDADESSVLEKASTYL
jgi:hypothetical protein